MEAAVDRRTTEGARISLDVPVELAHTGHEEKFVADAVNLGLGGLTMRAPYLPDIGQPLTCRFETRDGQSIEAGAEVAWSDPSAGQFGLHFVSVPAATRRTLRDVVLGAVPVRPEPTTGETSAVNANPAAVQSVRRVGADEPLPGRVLSASALGLSFEQALPDLELDSSFVVDESGALGRLANVHLALEDGTPRLVLDILYEGGADDPRATSEATIPDFLLCEEPAFLVESKDEISTLDLRNPSRSVAAAAFGPDEVPESPLFREEEVEDAIDLMLAEKAFDEATTFNRQEGLPARAEDLVEALDESGAEEAASEHAEGVVESLSATGVAEDAAEPDADAESLRAQPHAKPPSSFTSPIAAKAFQRLGTDFSAVRRWFGRRAAVLSWLTTVWSGARDWTRQRGMPLLTAQVARARRKVLGVSAGARRAVARLRVEHPRFGLGRRTKRKTAPAPHGSNVALAAQRRDARRRGHGEPLRRVKWGRWLLLAVIVGVAVALLRPVFGESTAEPMNAAVTPKPAFLALAKLSGTEESSDGAVESFEGSDADAEPTRGSGDPRARTDSLPASSPYAVDVNEAETTSSNAAPPAAGTSPLRFGEASVPGGEAYVLRMSQPVTELEGRPLDRGFSVVVPGTLSLDRAGPLARSHPLVEHSTILNRGDHAELSVRFVEGRKPAYRVQGRGAALEITIAQR